MWRMKELSYKMNSSSLVGPMGKDYRQPKAIDHRKPMFNYILGWQKHGRQSLPRGVHTYTYWTIFLLLCHKKNDFQFFARMRV